MSTGVSIEQIKVLAEEVLHERFENVEITDIKIVRDVDEDGDDILHIRVVFDGEKKTLDSRRASSVARHMIPRLVAAGEYAFPVFSYIAKADLGRSKAAAFT